MTTIRFFKTNRVDDPGFERSPEDVAREFWASDAARDWLAHPGWRLERLAMVWVVDNVGQWENVPADWEPIFDAIHAAMPRGN